MRCSPGGLTAHLRVIVDSLEKGLVISEDIFRSSRMTTQAYFVSGKEEDEEMWKIDR